MKGVKFIPNALTGLRASLCPVIAYLFVHQNYSVGLFLFLIASGTDFLDGYLARRWNVTSTTGAVLDPLCDKFYCIAFFSVLMARGDCPAWFLGLVITISLLQICGYLCLAVYESGHPIQVSSSPLGQWNTTLQYFWIGVLFLNLLVERHDPQWAPVSEVTQLLGYTFLALAQIWVFYRYFLIYRVHLVPDLRPFSTLNS
jgi:CDP-diacylglycerol--glycerol-3-phosphate 3-phosphatidyltransferase